ncbi:hypothetical protein AB205_0082740 [Aquarana catesbeiana]|uniref:Uncharacterized protein n=1 Tax=Aquarana catesbeiana TaxID=8400 RepID=A0A2G9RGX6_AQUCT|nr:hypothetical protein AB205_0082740 [Aquarana catesbeiana]
MREQIAPFHTEFTIKEISLDLKKTRDAAFKILHPRTVPGFFRLNSTNAILEFLLQGTPEIKEHYLDSKKDVDRQLKAACEQFIQQQSKIFVEPLEDFMAKQQKASTALSQAHESTERNQWCPLREPMRREEHGRAAALMHITGSKWGSVKINDLVSSTYKTIKTKLPGTLRSMSLYLANKDTEFILFKPVRSNIQQVFQKIHMLLKEEFSSEDLQIIACPSMEQVNLLLSMSK